MTQRLGMRWTVGILAAAISLEIFLRLAFGLGHPLLTEPDPGAGYMPLPNQDLHRFRSHIQINSLAMRSPEFATQKAPGDLRLFFLGDSITFGTTLLDQAQIFTSVIQESLQSQVRSNVQVLNASCGGWAPSNELGYLRERGTVSADVVISVINTQDLVQPFQYFHANNLNPTKNPATAIGELVVRYIAPKIFPNLEVHDAGVDASANPPIESQTPRILKTLAEMHNLATRQGARYMVIFVPTASAARSAYRDRWAMGVSLLLDWAKKEDVPVLDMREALSHSSTESLYLDAAHLKPAGHKVVADSFLSFYGPQLQKLAQSNAADKATTMGGR